MLGCSGGSARGHLPTSFLIDGRIAVDGGAVTTALAEDEQERIDHVVISHAHLDHVATLPFLLDNRFARQRRPITFYACEETLQDLKEGLFNNRVWPDFTALKNRKSVALELKAVRAGAPFHVEGFTFTASAMAHPVPCFGYLIEDQRSALYIAGDTGSAEPVKRACAARADLAAIVIEISWPDRMAELAGVTGHLVPRMLREAWPLHPTAEVLVSHIKPFYREEVIAELAALRLPGLTVLEDGMERDW